MTNLPKILIHKFQFTIEALEDMLLPEYKGSMFRGAFGWAFKEAVCVTKKHTCDNCHLQRQCSYFKIFETEMPQNDLWFLHGVKKIPHPFVIHPPNDYRRAYKKGETITVGLTIFGDSISLFPFFIYAFQKMGEKGVGYKRDKFRLILVENISSDNFKASVFNHQTGKLNLVFSQITNKDVLENRNVKATEATLTFITPFRLQEKGVLINQNKYITTEIIFRSIIRRYFLLSKLFCGENLIDENYLINFKDIKIDASNLYFKDWSRFSNRQERKVAFGGFIGPIKLTNLNKQANTFLLIGEQISIGKNTVFGLGKYVLQFE